MTERYTAAEQRQRKLLREKIALRNALLDSTVSSSGKTITIECGGHATKDTILDFLTGAALLCDETSRLAGTDKAKVE